MVLFFIFYFFFFCFVGVHPWHMKVPRLGVELELQLPASTIDTAMPDPSHICILHCSLQQLQVFHALSEARDQTPILMDTSGVLNMLSHNGNSSFFLIKLTWCTILCQFLLYSEVTQLCVCVYTFFFVCLLFSLKYTLCFPICSF